MECFDDFNKVSVYVTYINNIKWTLKFNKDKILISNDLDYTIYSSQIIIKEVSQYKTYGECFTACIKELNDLILCKLCNRLDSKFCRYCTLDEKIDELTENTSNEECPICYKKISARHVVICADERHKICVNCYSKIHFSDNYKLCPLCRNTSQTVTPTNPTSILDDF